MPTDWFYGRPAYRPTHRTPQDYRAPKSGAPRKTKRKKR